MVSGKPWDRQPVSGKLRRKLGVSPGFAAYRPSHPKRLSTRQRPCAQCENECLLAAILIFAGTYFVLAVGRIPFLRVDRTGAAIVGASLMLAFNVLTGEGAYAASNYDPITLLVGMMIVVANLRLSGFFAAVAAWVVTTRTPR